MFDVCVRVYGVVWLFVLPSCKKKIIKNGRNGKHYTQRCSRERCAKFLLGGDFMSTDQDGGKVNSGPKFWKIRIQNGQVG